MAKAVLLLKQVHEIVPLNEGNIAVAVMDDLNGRSWISTTNRVGDSLTRLQKYVRPAREEGGASLRFATPEEWEIYDDTERNEADADWDAVVEMLDTHLWNRIITEISPPKTIPYGESGEEYPVSYRFSLDGTPLETERTSEGGIDIHIEVQGVHPGGAPKAIDEKTLYWEIDTDGLNDLRTHLVNWWALRDAVSEHDVPPPVEYDLNERADAAVSKLVSAMSSGSFSVKDRTDIHSLPKAVRTAVEVTDPDGFHPMLLQIDADRLRELQELESDDPLPAWAQTIQVPSSNDTQSQGKRRIQGNVFSLTGRQLDGKDDGLALATVLDGIIDQRPFYADARPALRAILWGFCREGRLLPIDEDGEALADEAVLQSTNGATTRLKLLPRDPIDKWLREEGYMATTETVSDGLIRVRDANRRVRSQLHDRKETAELTVETDIHSEPVPGLVNRFVEALETRIEATDERLSVVRSQGDGIENAIRETTTAEDWLDEVTDVWERRRGSLHRLDAVLTIGDERFEWLDDDATDALTDQRDAVVSFDGDWWTEDGWRTFSDVLTPGLADELARAWDSFVGDHDLNTLVAGIDEHPWIVPAGELPAGIHATFGREYITPLRQLKQWYATIDDAITTLTQGGDGSDAMKTADAMSTVSPLEDAVTAAVSTLTDRLDRLSAIVGDRALADVDQVGIVPDDRSAIEQHLKRVLETHDIEIAETDAGVIVR